MPRQDARIKKRVAAIGCRLQKVVVTESDGRRRFCRFSFRFLSTPSAPTVVDCRLLVRLRREVALLRQGGWRRRGRQRGCDEGRYECREMRGAAGRERRRETVAVSQQAEKVETIRVRFAWYLIVTSSACIMSTSTSGEFRGK